MMNLIKRYNHRKWLNDRCIHTIRYFNSDLIVIPDALGLQELYIESRFSSLLELSTIAVSLQTAIHRDSSLPTIQLNDNSTTRLDLWVGDSSLHPEMIKILECLQYISLTVNLKEVTNSVVVRKCNVVTKTFISLIDVLGENNE